MNFPVFHTSRWSRRRLFAVALMVIYLLIALSPLAPLALHSRSVAHAVTGECSGDCNVCGCSLESRAKQTCCCAKKKQKLAAELVSAEQAIGEEEEECCKKKRLQALAEHDEHVQQAPKKEKLPESGAILKCGCPCGKSTVPALAHSGASELLPYIYAERLLTPHEDCIHSPLLQRMTSRYAEPPDPPPKLSLTA